jgi:hypothetical protein
MLEIVIFMVIEIVIVQRAVFRSLSFRFFRFNQGVRGGFLKGSKVADFLHLCGQALSCGVVRRTALLTLLASTFCA